MAEQTHNDSQVPSEKFLGIENRNFLSPIGFKLAINRLRGVDFYCQQASIPAIGMQPAQTGTRFNMIMNPGDQLYYEDFTIRFLIDENMKNWYQVHDWIRKIATPYSSTEFDYERGTIQSQNKSTNQSDLEAANNQWRSDISLFILSSNYQPVAEFVFKEAWPFALSTLEFNAAAEEIQYFTAEVSFKYDYFDYYIYEAANATDASMKPNYRQSTKGVTI